MLCNGPPKADSGKLANSASDPAMKLCVIEPTREAVIANVSAGNNDGA